MSTRMLVCYYVGSGSSVALVLHCAPNFPVAVNSEKLVDRPLWLEALNKLQIEMSMAYVALHLK
jgi:hypothetical protein